MIVPLNKYEVSFTLNSNLDIVLFLNDLKINVGWVGPRSSPRLWSIELNGSWPTRESSWVDEDTTWLETWFAGHSPSLEGPNLVLLFLFQKKKRSHRRQLICCLVRDGATLPYKIHSSFSSLRAQGTCSLWPNKNNRRPSMSHLKTTWDLNMISTSGIHPSAIYTSFKSNFGFISKPHLEPICKPSVNDFTSWFIIATVFYSSCDVTNTAAMT